MDNIINKKLALFIFVIVLIIPSYVSANLDFYKEGSQYYIRYYDADEQAYNSVAFPSECSIVGSPQHYLGARVAIVFADCYSQGPKAYFYDSYWNEWTAETPDGEFTSGADSYAVGAAGVNVAVIAIGNANDRVAYAYDYNKKQLFPYRGSANTILGNAPFKASAGKNNGLIASVYDGYAYAYSTEVGWKQYFFSLPLKEMGSANEFSALVGDDNVYLYKSGLSNLVFEDFDGSFGGLDIGYDAAAFKFGEQAFLVHCKDSCASDNSFPIVYSPWADPGYSLPGFAVGDQLAMFYSTQNWGTIYAYDLLSESIIDSVVSVGGTFKDIDSGGNLAILLVEDGGIAKCHIYDKAIGSYNSWDYCNEYPGTSFSYVGSYTSRNGYISSGVDNVGFAINNHYRGYKSGSGVVIKSPSPNYDSYFAWPSCIRADNIISQIVFQDVQDGTNYTSTNVFTNEWTSGQLEDPSFSPCRGYACCVNVPTASNTGPVVDLSSIGTNNRININEPFNAYVYMYDPDEFDSIANWQLHLKCDSTLGCDNSYDEYFEGDGNPGGWIYMDTDLPSHASAGYRATLKAWDGFGASNIDEVIFQVIDPALENHPPVVSIERIYPPKVFAGEEINFRASASDEDGDLLTYEWEFDGEIIGNSLSLNYDTSGLSGGIHLMRFRASDNESSSSVLGNFEIMVVPEPGTSWITLNSGVNDDLYSVDFITSNIGYAVGEDGTLIKTTNRFDWNSLSFPENTLLTGITFKDQDTGWISTHNGKIFKTQNGGSSWTEDLSTSIDFNGLDYFNAGWEGYNPSIYGGEVEPNYEDYYPLVAEEYYGGGAVYPGILMQLVTNSGQDILPDYSDCIESDYVYPEEPNLDYVLLSMDGYSYYDTKFCRIINQNSEKLIHSSCVPADQNGMCFNNKVLTIDTDYSLTCCNYVWPSGDIIINQGLATASKDLSPAGKIYYSEVGDGWSFANKGVALDSIDCVDEIGCFGIGGNDIIKATSYEPGSYDWFWDKDAVKDYSLQWNSIFQIPYGSSDNFNIVKTGNDIMYVSNGGQVYYYNGATLTETHDYGDGTVITDMYDDPYGQFHTAGYEINSIRYQAGDYNGDPHYEYRYEYYPLDGAVEGLQFVPKSVWGHGSEVYMAGYHVWPVSEYVEDGCLHAYQQGFTWYDVWIDCILYDYEHYGAVVYSGDSGNTWEFIGIEDVEGVELNDVFGEYDSFNGLSVFAVGDDEVIWDCTNDPCIEVRGHTGGPDLNAVMVGFYGSTFAAGEDGYIIYKSGPNWYSGSPEFSETINEIFTENHLGSNTVYAVGNGGGVYKKAWDGDWQVISQGIPYTDDCTDVTGGNTPDQTFVVCGNKVYKWFVDDSAESYNGISFVDNQKGWIVGDNGLIRSSVDGGDSWQLIHGDVQSAMQEENEEETEEIPTIQNDYSDISSFGGRTKEVDISAVYDVSLSPNSFDRILTFSDLFEINPNSLRYSPLTTESQNLYDVDFLNTTFGIASGAHGAVLGTMDGGNSWNIESYADDTYGSMRDVEILDESNIYVVGDGGAIMYRYINNPPTDTAIEINSGLSEDPNHPDTPYYTSVDGGNIVLEGSANDQDSIEYEWSVTEDTDYVVVGSNPTLNLNPSSLDPGLHTIRLKVTDEGGLWGSATLEIRIKDTTPIAPTVEITSVNAYPYDQHLVDVSNTFAASQLIVTGCSRVDFEGVGDDFLDAGYIKDYNWSIDGEEVNNEASFSYMVKNIPSYSGPPIGIVVPLEFSAKDDDNVSSDIDNNWFVESQQKSGLRILDADDPNNFWDTQYGTNFCEAMCCGDDSGSTTSCNNLINEDLFEGDNTVLESSGKCCGDDIGEYYVVGDSYAKCCDAPDYDIITQDGCYYSNPNNLLRNPSFEIDEGFDYYPNSERDDSIEGNLIPDGWTSGLYPGNAMMDFTESNDGEASMKLTSVNRPGGITQYVPINLGSTYRVSAKMKVDSICENNPDCEANLAFFCFKEDYGASTYNCPIDSDEWPSVNSQEWTNVEREFTITEPETTHLEIVCYNSAFKGAGTDGTVWCDSLSVEEIDLVECNHNGICDEGERCSDCYGDCQAEQANCGENEVCLIGGSQTPECAVSCSSEFTCGCFERDCPRDGARYNWEGNIFAYEDITGNAPNYDDPLSWACMELDPNQEPHYETWRSCQYDIIERVLDDDIPEVVDESIEEENIIESSDPDEDPEEIIDDPIEDPVIPIKEPKEKIKMEESLPVLSPQNLWDKFLLGLKNLFSY